MSKFWFCLLLSASALAQERTVDKKFLLLNLAGDSAMVADYSTTRLNLNAGYREHNPILGNHPSNLRLLTTGSAWSAGLWASSYWLKKRGNKLWWTPRLGQVAVNSYFAARNAQASRR